MNLAQMQKVNLSINFNWFYSVLRHFNKKKLAAASGGASPDALADINISKQRLRVHACSSFYKGKLNSQTNYNLDPGKYWNNGLVNDPFLAAGMLSAGATHENHRSLSNSACKFN